MELVASKKDSRKMLKKRRVRFDLPVKEKEDDCSSGVSMSQNTIGSSHRLDQVKSFPPASVEGSPSVADKVEKRQEVMTPATRLQPECNLLKSDLPAKETKTTCSINAPTVLDRIGCTPKQQSVRSLLRVEEEIVQILAEMQMKATAPVEVHTNSAAIESNLEENVISNHLENYRSGHNLDVNDEETQVKTINNKQTECNGSGLTEDKTEGNQEATVTSHHLQDDTTVPVELHTKNAVTESNLEENIIQNDIENYVNGPVITVVTSGISEDKLEESVISNDHRDDDSGCSGNVGAAGCSGNIHAADSATKENITAIETSDKVNDKALGASKIRVQLAFKLVLKGDRSSIVLPSPPAVNEASRNVSSLQQGKSALSQDVQIMETDTEAEGNSQVSVRTSLGRDNCTVKQEKEDSFNGVLEERYPSNPTVADIRNSSIEENSDEIEVIYEKKKNGSIPVVVKHEKSSIQEVEAGHVSVDRKDMCPSNPTVADIHNSSIEENSDEIVVVYERRKQGPICPVVKCETTAQQEEPDDFIVETKDKDIDYPADTVNSINDLSGSQIESEESLNTIQLEKSIKTEQERNFYMDTCGPVASFQSDANAAMLNSSVDIKKSESDESDDEYYCPMCALAESLAEYQTKVDNEEKADCLDVITQNLNSGCPAAVSASNSDTAGNQLVTASLDSVKEEEPETSVTNCDRNSSKEETEEDHTDDLEPETSFTNCDRNSPKEETEEDYSNDLGFESPILDCSTPDIELKEEDSIDTEEHGVTCDYTTQMSITRDVGTSTEEILFSDQAEDAIGFSCAWFGWEQQESEEHTNEDTDDWDTDCPPEIGIFDTNTEGELQVTVITGEGIQSVVHTKVVDSPLPSKGDSCDQSDVHAKVVDSPLPSKGDSCDECELSSGKLPRSKVPVEDNSVGAHLHLKHQEHSLISTEDKSVEAVLHVKHQGTTRVSTEDKSVEANLHFEHQGSSAVSTEDKSIEAVLHLNHQGTSRVSTDDKSVEADLHFEHQGSSPVSTKDKSVECADQSRIVENPPASKEGKNVVEKWDPHKPPKKISVLQESVLPSGKLKRPLVSTGHSSDPPHSVPESWNPKRILLVKLRQTDIADYYKRIGSPVRDRKPPNIRKSTKKDQPQAGMCVGAPPEINGHDIPGDTSEDLQDISSDTLENTTGNSSQENNISSENYEGGDTAFSYNCNWCSDVFSSKYSLTKHVFTHTDLDAPVHICKYCGTVFNAAFELQNHNKSSCFGTLHKEPSHISYWAQKTQFKDGINSSMAKNESKYSCSSCTQVFTSKYCLIKHVFTHIDGVLAPPYICQLCGKVLSASFSLRRHYKYSCKTSYRNELQEDILCDDRNLKVDKVNNQEAAQVKYAVNTCDQGFPSKDIHDDVNGKKGYSNKCKVCGEFFRTASRFKRHISKICNRIEDSIQGNGVQGKTLQDIINDGSAKCKEIVGKTSHTELKCSTCKKVFNTEFHLEMHLSKKIKCTYVEHRDSVVDLYDKVRYLPEINDLSKQQSSISVSSAPSSNLKVSNIRVTYRKSVTTGNKEKVYLCDFCDKPFRKSANLLAHRHTHTGEKNCICSICGKSFAMVCNLKRHLMSHSKEYPFTCNICNRPFKQKEHLKRHNRIHTGEMPHMCHICGKLFRQSSSLQKHHLVHTGEKPHTCKVCGKAFALLGNLKQHSYTHSAERCYKCDICFKSFSRATTLKKHACITPGEGRQFKCNYCCKYFSTSSLLNQHLATHLGVGARRYKCNVCGKSFVGSGNLKIHMYVHTGDRPYICDVCGRTFNQPSSMKRHLRVHK